MMSILYGYSLLFILAGIFAYNLNAFQVLAIAVVTYLIDGFVFKTARRFWTIALTVAAVAGTSVFLLYRMELLETVWLMFMDFLMVYWLSILVTTVAIDEFHQMIALLFIGLLMMAPLEAFIRKYKDHYIYLIGFSVALVLVGYLTRSMGSSRDHQAFMILSATLIIYYFYNFYFRFTDYRRKFMPFFSTIILFILLVVAGSRILYAVDPRPLTNPRVSVSYVPSEDPDLEAVETDSLNYFRNELSEVADSFDFENIEILRIRSEEVNYLKADTFELYYEGDWTKAKDLANFAGDKVHRSDAFSDVDYNQFYLIEDVRIITKNFNTNVLLVNNYDVVNTRFYDGLQVINDIRRGTFFTNGRVDSDYVYEFEAIVPNYGSRALDDLAREYADEEIPDAFAQLNMPLSDRYGSVARLAAEITEGIDNKYDQALAVERYLQQNYTYSETPPVPPDNVDPIIYFLFESKEGFCQQFATSYALMMRSLGIPSRYAVGFYVGSREVDIEAYEQAFGQEFIPDGTYSVYDSNAHTWPELYFPEVGWIMFEPTPGRYYKAEEIDYDPYDFQPTEVEDQGLQLSDIDPDYYYYVAFGLIALFLFIMVFRMTQKRYNLKQQSPNEKLLAIHGLIRFYFKVADLEKGSSETPREFAKRADVYLFEMKTASFTALMGDYESVIYGGHEITPDGLKPHLDYLKGVRKLMRRRVNRFNYLRMAIVEFFGVNVG